MNRPPSPYPNKLSTIAERPEPSFHETKAEQAEQAEQAEGGLRWWAEYFNYKKKTDKVSICAQILVEIREIKKDIEAIKKTI